LLQVVADRGAVAEVPFADVDLPVAFAVVVVPVGFAPVLFALVVFYRIPKVPIRCRRKNSSHLPGYRRAVVLGPDGVATTYEGLILGGLSPFPLISGFPFLRLELDGSSDPFQLPGREPTMSGVMTKRPCTPSE